MPGGVAIHVGGVCPQCGTNGYATKYSLAHVLLCVFIFPIGLLCLLAPVKVCTASGHEYGLGATLRSFVGVIIGLFACLVIGIVILSAIGSH